MKKIGLIGGTTWESTVDYYRIINKEVNRRLQGSHSAEIIMYSFDFEMIKPLLDKNDFESVGKLMVEKARLVESAGAECLVLCANTAHKWADQIRQNINIPLIHIADATGREIQKSSVKKLALLGTKFTMAGDFITKKLEKDYGLEVVVPDQKSCETVHRIIFDELTKSIFTTSSKQKLIEIIHEIEHIDGVILACTELPLIVKPEDTHLKLFDTTEIHARAVVDFSLS
ncbi:MAG: amino acid racemase [Bacteroidales bacterium]|nr:amino acid racemase [Bacteroidales bacterium]